MAITREAPGGSMMSDVEDHAKKAGQHAADAAGNIKDKIVEGAEGVKEHVKDAVHKAGEYAVEAKDKVVELATNAAHKTSEAVEHAGHEINEVIKKYPMQSLLVGAALGYLIACATTRG